jgi:Zn-dependent protease with chaperone function
MNNLRADFGFSIFTSLQNVIPSFGRPLAWIVIIILILAYGYEWNRISEADDRRFYWICCLSLAIAPLLGFRTEIEHLSILIIPLALIFSIVYDRWKIGTLLTILLLLILFVFPWLMYLLNPIQFAQEFVFLFLPVFTIIGLYWIRWWALRPPRLWVDLTKT